MSNEHIMIIDDEKDILSTMKLTLSMKGYRVTTFFDSKEALHEIVNTKNKLKYDLIITDIEMPELKGDELIDELQKLNIQIPVIVLTGYGDKDLVVELLRKGCADYIDKPITPQILQSHVEKILLSINIDKEKKDQAEKLMEIGSVSREISHDVNNLLSAMSGFSEIAIEENEEGKNIDFYLKKIKESSFLATDLIRNMVTYAKNNKVEYRELNLTKEIKKIAIILDTIATRSNSLIYDCDDSIPCICADSISITRILVNLVKNAKDSIYKHGKIIIKTEELEIDEIPYCNKDSIKPGKYIKLSVSDDGCGMDKETKGHIFDLHYTTKYEGSGVGLSSVLKLVNQLNASILVDSKKGFGSAFKIYFPVKE